MKVRAKTHPDHREFMEELHELFKRHNKAIVPTYNNSTSFHDHMTIEPYDNETQDFINNVTVEEE